MRAGTGGNSGSYTPVNDVQIIDVANHTIKLASWKLPVPLEGSAAFNINNELFLAGGQSNVPESIVPGKGTTQVPGVNVSNQSLTYNTIWAINPTKGQFLPAGQLQLPVSNSGVAVVANRAWIIGGEYNNQVVSAVQMVTPNTGFGVAGQPGAGSPYYGAKLMVADRGNNRIVVMNSAMHITWTFPAPGTNIQNAKNFYFPDDAFFANHGTEIISNQENNDTVVQIGYPSGKILWSFGHPLQPGSAYGYLRAPDDAYLLKNGNVVVADDQNCRVLFINPAGKVVGQIGTTGVCVHNPNVSLGSPNGDTPLNDGNILISEIIGSWVSEYTPQGKMVWAVHLPISYPSDPQQLGAKPGYNPNNYLIADYANPGSIIRFNRQGQILYKYKVTSGPGMLKYPSLVEQLPSGVYMANDDHRDRMVAIDPSTGALVWQYGVTDTPGTSVGMLHKPDGFDILLPNGVTPTHTATL
jgi:outer membrane protein assembly factor BamB